MNQPTREEFEEIKRRLARIERYTEPIKITQLEIESGSIFRRLDEIEENTNITKIQTEGVSGDLLQIRESQVDLRDKLVEHGQRLESIEQKLEIHTEILGQIMNFGERIEGTMATKDDIARIEKTQTEQGDLLKLILAELRKPRGE
jgi:tetrahydromethanopterin S-methyltransferase subunit G